MSPLIFNGSTSGSSGQVFNTDGSGNLSFRNTGYYQEFLSSGTWTKPAGVTMLYIECVAGGGGGGGGGASLNGFNSGAGGNGGDGYVRVWAW